MAYTYDKQLWKDYPDTTTPITADRLNHMEDGISEAAKSGGGDTIPVGSEFDYDGTTVPEGFVQVTDTKVYVKDETEVGTWIDGKKIYRQVLQYGAVAANSQLKIPFNPTNLGSILFAFTTGYQGGNWFCLPRAHNTSFAYQNSIYWAKSDKAFVIETGSTMPLDNGFIVVFYEKKS